MLEHWEVGEGMGAEGDCCSLMQLAGQRRKDNAEHGMADRKLMQSPLQ